MNNYLKFFFLRISEDFKQKKLIPLKLLFFIHSSTILVLYPYLTLHMRELGINVEETAIMSSVIPFIAILMPPLAGMLADKIGNFRIMLAFFSATSGTFALLLLLVPVGRETFIYPERLFLGISCNQNQSIAVTLPKHQQCILSNQINKTEIILNSCGISCMAFLSDIQTEIVIRTNSYELKTLNLSDNTTKLHIYTVQNSSNDQKTRNTIYDTKTQKKIQFNTHTSIRKISKNVFYFPTKDVLNFYCNDSTCAIVYENKPPFSGNPESMLQERFTTHLVPIERRIEDFEEERQLFDISLPEQKYHCVRDPQFDLTHISITIPIVDSLTKNASFTRHLDLGSCTPNCLISIPRTSLCTNDKKITEHDMKLTFWSYLIVRVLIGIVSGTSFAMFEGAVIAMLREHKADYGLQRIYSTIGGMISSPISGVLIDFASRDRDHTDFRPVFFLYAVLKIISGILMLFINLEFKKPSKSVMADVKAVLGNIELISLFFACLVLGSAWGYIESFLFWLLQDLGSSKSLMGLTITVGGLIGIPLLVLSGPIIEKMGHANVILLSFIFYAIRLVGYSLILNPWLCLIFEAMESITVGLGFTAAVTYAAKLSTITTDTTVQGMLGGLYYGVGKGLGTLLGGYLIQLVGIRATFQYFAAIVSAIGVLYFLFYRFCLKKLVSKNVSDEIEKEKSDKKGGVETETQIVVQYKSYEDNSAFEDTEFESAQSYNKTKSQLTIG